MASYDDFVKSWQSKVSQNEALKPYMGVLGEGGGISYDPSIRSDPNEELRARFGLPANWSGQQIAEWGRANGLPDPIAYKYDDLLPALAIPGAFLGAGALTGAFSGAGTAAGGAAQFPSQVAAQGGMMPAAIPESAATLQGWGLSEVAPGVWAAGGAGAAGAGAAAGGASGAAGGASGAGAAGGTAVAGLPGILSNPSILGAAGGALLGGLGGSEQAGTVTTEEGLPDWLAAYARPALDKYSTQIQNYNVDPYGIMPAAGQEFRNTIGGMYLDPSTNKYLEQYFNAGAERVKGTLSPSFGHMQAFGGHSGYNEALSRGLSDLATGIYGGNYQKERDRQTSLTAAAPNFLTANTQAQFSPYQSYLSSISGLGRKSEKPYFENPFGNMLGGAMAGYGLGSIFK